MIACLMPIVIFYRSTGYLRDIFTSLHLSSKYVPFSGFIFLRLCARLYWMEERTRGIGL